MTLVGGRAKFRTLKSAARRFASEVFAPAIFALTKVKLLRSEVCAKGTSEVLALPKWRQRDRRLRRVDINPFGIFDMKHIR